MGRRVDRLHRTCPETMEHVWSWFKALSNARVRPTPISFAEVSAWAALTRLAPTPWEVDCIMELDTLFRSIVWRTNNA